MYKLLYKNPQDEIIIIAESDKDIIYYDDQKAWLVIDVAWVVDYDKIYYVEKV